MTGFGLRFHQSSVERLVIDCVGLVHEEKDASAAAASASLLWMTWPSKVSQRETGEWMQLSVG